MADYTQADLDNTLNQPGILSYREYNTSDVWTDVLLVNSPEFSASTDQTENSFDDVGVVEQLVGSETVDISAEYGQVLNMDGIDAMTGGLFTKETVAGTEIAGATQTVASGSWSYDQVKLFDGQNSDGTVPTAVSISAGTDGALTEDVDFFLIKLPEVGWGFYVTESVNLTTEAQELTVTFTYTPKSKTILKRGGTKYITPIELKFTTKDRNGYAVAYIFHKAYATGEFGHGFGAEESAEVITTPINFTVKKDTSRTTGDQLFRIERDHE